jgi:DNA-binding ferritin-like protein
MDIISSNQLGVSGNDLLGKTFQFLISLMGYRDQLRMNHWQTEKFSEHKLTDDIMTSFGGSIDSIGETTLGIFGRPTIKSTTNTISDISLVSTESIIKAVETEVLDLLEDYKQADYEGMVAILGEFDAEIKKFKFICTLQG